MRKKIVEFFFWRIISCLLLVGWYGMAGAQTVVGTRNFISQVAGVDGAAVNDMVKMSRASLYSLHRSLFGIRGTINNPGGKITISIYVSENDIRISRLIFQVSIIESSSDHYSAHENVILDPPDYPFGSVHSNDPYTLALAQFANDYPGLGIISLRGEVPVIVVVTVTDATFIESLLPGIGRYTLDFPWGHPCFGKISGECNTLREFRLADLNKVVVIPHRGVWGSDDTPEGGTIALYVAREQGFAFTELDIRLSKDKWPLLLHDQEINRMTDLPPTPDGSDLASIENLNAYNSSPGIPARNPHDPGDQNYGLYTGYPALSSGHLKDRYGKVNSEEPLSDLSSALQYLELSKMFLILDIQEKDLHDYLLATYQCLKLAKDRGMLHKIIFKHGSTAFLTREELQEYLSTPGPDHPENLWSDYAYKTSTIVTIHPADVNDPLGDPLITGMDPISPHYGLIHWTNLKARIDDWMKLPSVLGYEVIFKCEQWDPMLTPNISEEYIAAFQGKSVVRYLKDMSYRTGNQLEIPTDCRGIPDGRGAWYDKSSRAAEPYLSYSPDCFDLRGNPEWIIKPTGYLEDINPGFIITDMADQLVEICTAFGKLNINTFRE